MTTTVSGCAESAQCDLGSMLDDIAFGDASSPLHGAFGWNWTVDAGAMIFGLDCCEVCVGWYGA